MANIVTAAQLRAILGVSPSLYNDAFLVEMIDVAEGVVLPMLTANQTSIYAYELKNNVATFYAYRDHDFAVGDSVVVSGLPSPFSATQTVTAVGATFFQTAITHADVPFRKFVPMGTAYLSGYSAAELYANNKQAESAVLAVATEVFQSRTAVGGQIEGTDFTVQPYRLGRGLINRVIGILGDLYDVNSLVG